MIKILSLLMGFFIFAFSFVNTPFIQKGHTNSVKTIACSHNGKYIASGSDDNSIKIWDVKSQKLIKTLKGHKEKITYLSFNSSTNRLYSSSYDGLIKIWDIIAGKEIKYINTKSAVNSFIITSNEKYIFFINKFSNELKVWDLNSNKLIKNIKAGNRFVNSLSLSRDEQLLVTGSEDGVVKIFDIKKLKFTTSFNISHQNIKSLSFFKDNKLFIQTRNSIQIWNLKTKKMIKKINYDRISESIISKNSKYILLNHSKYIELLDANTLKTIKKFGENFKTKCCLYFHSINFLVDEKSIVFGYGKEIVLWKDNNYKIFSGNVKTPKNSYFSNDGLYLISNYEDYITIWNLHKSEIEFNIKTKSRFISLSPNGKWIISSDTDNNINLWDIKTKKLIKQFIGHKNRITSLSFFSDSTKIISSDTKNIKIWDLQTAKELKSFKPSTRYNIDFVSLSPDDKYFIYTAGFNVNLIKISSFKEIKKFTMDSPKMAQFSPDGKYIIFNVIINGRTYLFDINKNKTIKKFKESYVSSFSPDGKILALGGYDNNIYLWDVKRLKLIKTFKGHNDKIESISFSPKSPFISSSSVDGTIKVWDIKNLEEIETIVSFKESEFVAITPDGYFSASNDGAKNLNVLISPLKVVSLDNFYEKFYRPDVIANRLSGNIEYAKVKANVNVSKLKTPKPKFIEIKPAPDVEIVKTKTSINQNSLKVTLKITLKGGGYGEIRIYLDGVLLKTENTRALALKKDKAIYKTYTLKLNKGKHKIKAIVFNEENTMASNPAFHEVYSTYEKIEKPNMYALIIGINDYKNPTLKLKYAVPDAKAFAKSLQNKSKTLFNKIDITLLTNKEDTTKDNISKIMKKLENLSPNDMFVFYVASHGIVEDGKYYMITSNVGSLSMRKIKKEAIYQDDIKNLIANIPTSKKMIILDTCHSGALGELLSTTLTRGLTEVRAIKVLSRAVGSTIISASSSEQEALEGYNGHGLLTYVLVEGLNGKADLNKDNYIKNYEISNYVEDKVPEIADKVFNREQYPFVAPNGQGFPIVKVK